MQSQIAEKSQQIDTRSPIFSQFKITNIEQLAKLFSRWDGKFEQLTSGRLEGMLQIGKSEKMLAHLGTSNQSILIRACEQPGVINFSLVLPESTGCTWHGHKVETGSIIARSGKVEIDHKTSKRSTNLTVVFPEQELIRAFKALTQYDPSPVRWQAIKKSAADFDRIKDRVSHYFSTLSQSSLPNLSEIQQVEQSCLTVFAEAFVPDTTNQPVKLTLRARSQIVHKAEEFMRNRLSTGVSEIELCEHLKVSGRTLRLAFREKFGMGPLAFYQNIRLHAARQAFHQSNHNEITIADIALRFGFSHFGKFAGYYKRLFGELPTQTIRSKR